MTKKTIKQISVDKLNLLMFFAVYEPGSYPWALMTVGMIMSITPHANAQMPERMAKPLKQRAFGLQNKSRISCKNIQQQVRQVFVDSILIFIIIVIPVHCSHLLLILCNGTALDTNTRLRYNHFDLDVNKIPLPSFRLERDRLHVTYIASKIKHAYKRLLK